MVAVLYISVAKVCTSWELKLFCLKFLILEWCDNANKIGLKELSRWSNNQTSSSKDVFKMINPPQFIILQKQPSRGVLTKRYSKNIQQIYEGTPMPKCNFNKVAKQLYWSHTSVWVISRIFAAYFQCIFS